MDKNLKTALIIGGIVVALLIIVPAIVGSVSGWSGSGWGMMGPGMMSGFGWMWFMPIIPIVVIGLIIWAVVALVRGTTRRSSTDPSKEPDSAMEMLKRRYARGDIDKEEFEEKKKDLA